MAHRELTPLTSHTAHHRLLVFGVAAIVLGVAMVSQGVLASQPAARLLPGEHAALTRAARPLPVQDEQLAATTSSTDRIPATRAGRIASIDATPWVVACLPHFNLDHDPRLVLSAMALQGRRFVLERAVGSYGTAGKQYVPTNDSALARAAESVWLVRAETSPPAASRPVAPGY